jgi:phosphoribosylaminoimidazole-succinocarboxamide synthase
MQKKELMYEGKAKQVFSTDDENLIIMHFKDDATAFNGIKKAQILNKGVLNCEITNIIFNYLKENGIPTHFVEKLNARDQLCKKVNIIPLEVIVRNIIAGSMAKRLDIPEGTKANTTIFEICYKNDKLGDPLINDDHAVALNVCTRDELNQIRSLTLKINELLQKLFAKMNITLVDFKIEFGKDRDGNIVLADEISPDSCRLWDSTTNEKLDKDRFRRDLGKVVEAYEEILSRLKNC